jgi:Truncated hemoglobins
VDELFREVGGAEGLKTAVGVFYERVTRDPELAPYFEGVDLDRLRSHQHAFLVAALGGPELFTGRPLERAHAHVGVTEAHFDRLVDHLAETLGDLGGDPVYVAAVRERVTALRPRVVAPAS